MPIFKNSFDRHSIQKSQIIIWVIKFNTKHIFKQFRMYFFIIYRYLITILKMVYWQTWFSHFWRTHRFLQLETTIFSKYLVFLFIIACVLINFETILVKIFKYEMIAWEIHDFCFFRYASVVLTLISFFLLQ